MRCSWPTFLESIRSLPLGGLLGVALAAYLGWPVQAHLRILGEVEEITEGRVEIRGHMPLAWRRVWSGPVGPFQAGVPGAATERLIGEAPQVQMPGRRFGWSPVCEVRLVASGWAGQARSGRPVVVDLPGPRRPRMWWWLALP